MTITNFSSSFNEPDIGSQANMDVPTAVSKWREIMEPYGAQGVRLGSPGITSIQGDPNAGLPWLKSFLTQCTGCKVDFIAIHYYDHEGNVQRFIDYLSYVRDQLVTMGVDKPIWVTEVGVLPGQAAAADPNVHLSFMKGVCDFMDSQSYVERYAYFGTVPGPTIESKMVENGQLNAIGQAYNA